MIPCSVDNRVAIELPGLLFAEAANVQEVSSLDATALNHRVQHGTLMAVNFILVFPLGALMARQLRARWLKYPNVKALLFYLHIGTQVGRLVVDMLYAYSALEC